MSKFILALDSSQISTYMKCPTQWLYSYEKNLKLKGSKKLAADRGTLIHTLLENYYTELWKGTSPTAALKMICDYVLEIRKTSELPQDVLRLVLQRMVDYVSNYANDTFAVDTIRKVDSKSPALEVGFSKVIFDNEEVTYVLEGKIDAVGSINGTPVWMDHKTQDSEWQIYPETIQFKNYALATGIKRGIINYIRLHKECKDNTFERKLMYFSQAKLDFWKYQVFCVFDSFHHAIKERNFQQRWNACQEERYRLCPFTSLCEELNPVVKEQLIQINYEDRGERWTPWR